MSVDSIRKMSTTFPWPADLDALVAAPAQHRLLLDNDRVRVLETRIEPGERTPVHTHQWPAVNHVLSWSAFLRRAPDGAVLLDTRASNDSRRSDQKRSPVFWGEPLAPHTLENVGTTPLHLISVELKTP